MKLTKLFENRDIIFGKGEDGEYYLVQPITLMQIEDMTGHITNVRERGIAKTLKLMSMPQNLLGFELVVEAVELLMKNPELKSQLVNGIYAEVAKKHGITADKVERRIRFAISRIPKSEKYLEVIGTTKRVSNGRFLVALANYQK